MDSRLQRDAACGRVEGQEGARCPRTSVSCWPALLPSSRGACVLPSCSAQLGLDLGWRQKAPKAQPFLSNFFLFAVSPAFSWCVSMDLPVSLPSLLSLKTLLSPLCLGGSSAWSHPLPTALCPLFTLLGPLLTCLPLSPPLGLEAVFLLLLSAFFPQIHSSSCLLHPSLPSHCPALRSTLSFP